ncbi:MAG: hypothetical protein GY847_21985 [Proteobacteria bacterium]|nr:hypothetical protein [Pseudomonadota bacterium]
MENWKNNKDKHLVERVVRNDDIFCSLLFDQQNRTLRVVDFRGGNFQNKHTYLEKVLMSERMRKIFTLIERDDISGWQRVGYQREGSIPGYYKRSDAYIMSKIYDEDYDVEDEQGEDLNESKKILNDIKVLGKDLSEQKIPGIRLEQAEETTAIEAIKNELKRQEAKAAKAPKIKGKKSTSKKKTPARAASDSEMTSPIFPQFSREVEFYYFIVQNRRTKQSNIIGAEYQDCFGNTKVEMYFSPQSRADHSLARGGLTMAIDTLTEIGAVSIFATADSKDVNMNALYASAGFRNTGWMNRQTLTKKGPKDLILWTRKLI